MIYRPAEPRFTVCVSLLIGIVAIALVTWPVLRRLL